MNKLDPFEDFISNKLNQHKVDFSYDSWDAIEKKLPKAKPNVISIVAIVLIAIAATTFCILNYNEDSSNTAINPSIVKEDPVEEHKEAQINTYTLEANDSSNSSSLKKPIISSKTHKSNSKEKALINETIVLKGETVDYHTNEPEQQSVYSPIKANEDVDNPTYLAEIDSNLIEETYVPIAAFTVSKKILCPSESVKFSPQEKENSSYFWDFNDGSTSNEISPTHQYNSNGTYRVTLKTKLNNNGNLIALSNELIITVNESPQIDFQHVQVVVDGVPQILFTPNYIFNNTIEWDFGDGEISTSENPKHNFHNKGIYLTTLKQTNEYNCSSIITKPIEIKENFNLYAPNSFTPDGDGVNDTFIPESLKLMNVEFIMTIYNKQGKLIYKTKNINQPWDGFNQNTGEKCIQGSYIWIIQLINKLGQNEQYKGPLLILD